MNKEQEKTIKAITEFRNDIENVLQEHLMNHKLPSGIVIYKDKDFENFTNLNQKERDKFKKEYFIPLYHGLLHLGSWDYQNLFTDKTGFIALSKYL